MVCRSGEVVINENVMLGPRPYEPHGTLRFGQQTSGGINRGLVSVQGFKVVVRKPDPRALEIAVRLGSEVDGQERREAVTVSHRVLWTLRNLKLRSGSPTEADVRIPQSRATLEIGVNIPLQDDRSCG